MIKENNHNDNKNLVSIPGRRSVLELLRHRPERINQIYFSESAKFDSEVLRLCDLYSVPNKILSKEQFRELSIQFDIESVQGIIAEVSRSSSLAFDQFLEKCSATSFPLIVALDQIQDPHNLGAIFRVCDCAGVSGIFFPKTGSVGVNSTVRRTSVGASEIVPYSEVSNLSRALIQSKEKGFLVFGTSLSEKSESIHRAVFSLPMVIVLGGEHSGLRHQTEKLCDSLIHLPMYGLMQSLNVSTAASAILFELRRVLK